ncbi:MAG: transcription factor FapR [Acidaminococcaceae bacterium]|jgi:acyl-coenzyme A thioesterase PaaI-like protein|nr:transcription factor FapR [Acidaminococcaceae bacterium]
MGDAMNVTKKQIRQQRLLKELRKNPFLTDEQLSQTLKVSIQTIRLDRLGQGIPELRERTRQMAEDAQNKLQAIASKDIVGELLDLELGKSGISMMNVTQDMVMAKTGIARGHFMFAQANTLALAVIDAPAALTGVANVKYKVPIYAGASLIARAEVIRIEDKKYFIWVKIRNNNEEVFRAKFIVVSLPNERIV